MFNNNACKMRNAKVRKNERKTHTNRFAHSHNQPMKPAHIHSNQNTKFGCESVYHNKYRERERRSFAFRIVEILKREKIVLRTHARSTMVAVAATAAAAVERCALTVVVFVRSRSIQQIHKHRTRNYFS